MQIKKCTDLFYFPKLQHMKLNWIHVYGIVTAWTYGVLMLVVYRACWLCVGYRVWEDGAGFIEEEGNLLSMKVDNAVLFYRDCGLCSGHWIWKDAPRLIRNDCKSFVQDKMDSL